MRPTVNIDHWIAEFPLAGLRAEALEFVEKRRQKLPGEYPTDEAFRSHVKLMEPSPRIISTPCDLAVREQFLVEAPREGRRFLPTDVFVWGLGEALCRECTKIGGLPYWPKERPWPLGTHGFPATFLAQLCFLDSSDHVATPSPLLLIFTDGEYGQDFDDEDPDAVQFFWVDITDDPLLEVCPEQIWLPQACFGVRHRTVDLLDLEKMGEAHHWLELVEGTKIGGAPRWIQYNPRIPGTFLGSLGSFPWLAKQRHSFINLEEPPGPDVQDHLLCLGDMGSIYLYLTETGITADLQCY